MPTGLKTIANNCFGINHEGVAEKVPGYGQDSPKPGFETNLTQALDIPTNG